MNALLSKLWADDKGAVVAPEIILIVALTVIGIIPGLVALRNAENATLADIGNDLLAIQTNFSFAGFSIYGANVTLGTAIAQVGGLSFSATNNTYFISSESSINNAIAKVPVDPAP